MSVWKQLDKPMATRCRSLVTLHAREIWARFAGAKADRAESLVLVTESEEGDVKIRLEDRCILADALREAGSAAADEIDFVDLPPDAIMVMVVPAGHVGAIVVPLTKAELNVDGSA